jgi:hypothetical protein
MTGLFYRLKRLLALKTKRSRISSARPRLRLAVEHLEDRCVLSTFTWIGAAGKADPFWTTPANWKSDDGNTSYPKPGDTAQFKSPDKFPVLNANVNLKSNVTVDKVLIDANYPGTITLANADQQPKSFDLTVRSTYTQLSGTIAGSGTLFIGAPLSDLNRPKATATIGGPVTLKGGANLGNLEVLEGGTLSITPGGSSRVVTFDRRVITVNKDANLVVKDATIALVNNAAIANSGAFKTSDVTFRGNSSSITNKTGGTFTVTDDTGPAAVTYVQAAFNNQGTVSIEGSSATLLLTGGGTSSGPYKQNAGTQLIFESFGSTKPPTKPATFTWAKDIKFTGSLDAAQLPASKIILNASITLARSVYIDKSRVDFTGGTITGTGASYKVFASDCVVNWSGGAISNAQLWNQAGTLNLSGSPTLEKGGNVSNFDKMNLKQGTLNLLDTAQLINLKQFDIQDDSGIKADPNDLKKGQVRATITNNQAGTITKSGGAKTSTIEVPTDTQGDIIIQSGTLEFKNLTQAQKTQLKNKTQEKNTGKLRIAGLFRLDGGILENVGAAALNGEVSGEVLNTGGEVDPGGASSPGILRIDGVNGNYTQNGTGVLNIDLAGPVPGTGYDQLSVSGALRLGGSLKVNVLPGFAGDSFAIIDNAGKHPVLGTFAGLPEGASLTLGGRTFHITYQGNDGYDVVLHVVGATKPTTTKLASSLNPSEFGQPVTFTAVVTGAAPGAGTPTGTVIFEDGNAPLGTGTLKTVAGSNQATFTTSSLSVGSHAITAVYAGQGNFGASSSAPLFQVVNPASTTTQISSNGPTTYGQHSLVTVTVAAGSLTPTGDVSLSVDGGTPMTHALGSNGRYTFDVGVLGAGQHSLAASFAAQGNFAASSNTGTLSVNKAATQIGLTVTPNPIVYGQTLYFSFGLEVNPPGAGSPTGTVTVSDSFHGVSTVLFSQTLGVSGGGQFTPLMVGTHELTITYHGDNNFLSSTSSPDTLVVHQASTITTLTSSSRTIAYGRALTLYINVAIALPGGGHPTGTVRVEDTFNGTTTTLTSGQLGGSLPSFAPLVVGTHYLRVIYSGDNNCLGSISAELTEIVTL